MSKIFLAGLLSIFIFTQSSFAGSSKTSLSGVEKLFLEARYDAVISAADKLINSGSGNREELYYLKGLSQLKTGRFSNARASFDYIITNYRWSKRFFDAYLGSGDSYLLEGESAKALGLYNEMTVKFPSDKNMAIVYGRLASCYSKMGLSDKSDYYTGMARRGAPLSFEAKSGPIVSQPARGAAINRNAPAQRAPRMSDPKSVQGPGVFKARPDIYSVQIGSFKNKRNADKLAGKIAARGYESYVAIPVSTDDKLYRVKVGKLGSEEDASKLASRLRSDGYKTKICADDVCK